MWDIYDEVLGQKMIIIDAWRGPTCIYDRKFNFLYVIFGEIGNKEVFFGFDESIFFRLFHINFPYEQREC